MLCVYILYIYTLHSACMYVVSTCIYAHTMAQGWQPGCPQRAGQAGSAADAGVKPTAPFPRQVLRFPSQEACHPAEHPGPRLKATWWLQQAGRG